LFVVDSYKKLSPDSGDTTTELLKQMSQQLAGLQNNTYIPPQDAAPFSPTTAILVVNALWFLSLVTAIVSAFYVMLVQQWIRRYTQTSEELSSDQERVRTCLFLGTQKYHMSHAIGLIPLPLHISVFLFLSGLIIFLFTISRAMAIVVSVAVVSFGLVYIALTILPIIDDVCPYFTPMSYSWWYLWHTFLSAAAFCFHRLLGRIRRRPGPYYLGEVQSPRPDDPSNWSEITESVIDPEKSKQRLKRGLRGNIFRHAQAAPVDVDLSALTWLLQRPAMAEKSKFQEFVDHIPPQTLVQLSSLDDESGERTIRDHLSTLLRSCIHDTYKLEEKVRSRRLRICLNAFHHIVKPFTLLDEHYETVIGYVWSNFKDIKTVQELWASSDPAIRVTSRSISAHLARNFLRKPHSELEESELHWLQEVVGKSEDTIFDPLDPDHLSKRDHLNLQSFVFGVLSGQKDRLAIEHATRFAETLAILMNAGSSGALSKEIFSEEISSFIEWAEKCDHQQRDEVVFKLREIFYDFVAETTP
jgi:hypothetical protein